MAAATAARVAVSGGAGFIGTHTIEALVAAGAKVLVIDDQSHPCGEQLPVEVELVNGDCGSEAAAKALSHFKPQIALHLALLYTGARCWTGMRKRRHRGARDVR